MNCFVALLGLALTLLDSTALCYSQGLDRARLLSHARYVEASYDYVIIGAGTAGLTVADRLTEDGVTTVLVIEYGEFSDSPLITELKGGLQGIQTQFLYPMISVPQEFTNNRTTLPYTGKIVGGSSAVNAMMCVRGSVANYDAWGSFWNDSSGWTWEGLLPYFKKAMNFVPPNSDVTAKVNITYDASYWGNEGEVYAGWPSYQYSGTKAMVDAFRELPGVEFPPDSGAGETGVFWYPTHMDPYKVQRSYSRTGHYDNISRDNYHLVTGSKVTKIVLDGTTATGVMFRSNTTAGSVTVSANKEVILSAGALHSPQILQLSGIGPKALLDTANIETVVDLPGVGQNFHDHPRITNMNITFQNMTLRPSAADLASNATFIAEANAQFAANRTGPNSIAIGNAIAFLPLSNISPRWEEIATNLSLQDHASLLPANTDPTVLAGYVAQMNASVQAIRASNAAFYGASLTGGTGGGSLVLLHPLSRGTVNIDPADPANSEPLVDYRVLSNPLDAAVVADMIRYTRRYFFATSLGRFSPVETVPGANVTSEEDLVAFTRASITPTQHHPAGTAAMLPLELGGVVGEELKVHGVQGLRVVDASVIPMLPGANTCQTVYAIAEKAADMIKFSAQART